jgi:hypothetical protein
MRSTEWLGVWVSRAHVLALLPEDCRQNETDRQGAACWVAAETKRMKEAKEIPPNIRITDFARALEAKMQQAAKTDRSLRPVGWRHIKNMLPVWGLWPVSSIK